MAFSKIILLVRRSQDWFHGECDQLRVRDRFHRRFRHVLGGWKMFFELPYVDFRRKLSLLARKTYLPNEFDAIFYWCDWDTISKYTDGTWVVPIDEDDWLSCRFVSVVRETVEKCSHENLIQWEVAYGNSHGDEGSHGDLYPSCSYAVRMPFPELLMRHHWRFWRRPIDFSYSTYKVSDVLTLKIENISSISFMWHGGFDRLIEVAKERQFLDGSVVPEEFRSYVGEYNEILRELYDSCRV